MASSSQAETPSPETCQSNFENGVALSLNLWPALTLAVQNGWGGPDSSDKRDWFAGVVVDLFPSFVDVAKKPPAKDAKDKPAAPEADLEDVETLLLQVMLDEFEVNVDDESGFEVAEQVVRLRKDCARGRFGEVVQLQHKWEVVKGKKVAFKQAEDADQDTDWDEDDDEDDDDEEDSDSDADVQMDEAPPLARQRSRTPPQVDEDGFTRVVRKKR